MLGCFEFLLLLGIIAGLLVLLGRYPSLGKILFWPLHNRRAFSNILLSAALCLGLLALLMLTLASLREPVQPSAKLFLFFMFFALLLLLVWALVALIRPLISHPKETQVERPLFEDLAQLAASMTARVSRLSYKDVLLGSFVLVGLCMLILLAAHPHPPRQDELFAVVFVLFFWWAISSLVFWLIVWLLRRLFRGTCPSVSHLKALLAERLSAEERARLTTHLELCPVCQHRVEGLTAGHNSWPGLARKLSERPAEPEPALRKVMQHLKDHEEQTTDNEPALAGDLPLDFLSPSEKPGQLGRLERYEVLEEIGRGGMGVVLKAFDPSLHRVVAIKVLAPQLATSGVARKRFLREAKAAAAVTHDHIVTIHAVDEANGLPYLVMQYVAGQSLQDRIDKDGPLELADILRIGMQTASGLAAAHAHGIVHRDIKPANILLEEGVQRVKITDFGLARAMDDASLTQSGFVAGSPLYMAPEQARGEALDHRADLFSLGSVLYTMCTGRPPFRAANTLAVLRRVSEDRPRPIRESNPEIPDWLTDIVDRLMAKDPAERFASAAEVEEVLGRQLAQLQHAAWVPPPRSPSPAAVNGDVPGLPTSLTICPNCGANLHVPERMVGNLVHCSECGKPFHVEEGSEVMNVARPARWPQRPRFGWHRKLRGCLVIAAACVVLLFLVLLFMYAVVREAPRRPAATAAPKTTASRPNEPPHWKHLLGWLPAEATLFGAFDLKPFGSLSLDDPSAQAVLRLFVPEQAADKLTPENLGRIQIDGAALACYDDAKSGTNDALVLLEGKIWRGRKRILDFIRQQQTDKIQVKEEAVPGIPQLRSVVLSGPALPCALRIRGDQQVYLARPLNKEATESHNLKALERLPEIGARPAIYLFSDNNLSNSGYNPPWIHEALAKIPADACGAFLGDIPAVWRKALTDVLKLRVCPRTFVLHMRQEGQSVLCTVILNLDKTGTDGILRDDLEKWRVQGLRELQTRFQALKRDQQASALLGQILNGLRWQAKDGSVQTQIRISAQAWKALSRMR